VTAAYAIEHLANHDRSDFSCGDVEIDGYFRTRIGQDIRHGLASAFVAVGQISRHIAGFYTLAATSIDFGDLPIEVARRLPRYPRVPAVLIGRLGVAIEDQGRGLGAALLGDAAKRVLASGIGAHSLVVQPKTEGVAEFYVSHGFIPLPSRSDVVFLPLATAARLT
jgi:ribosomal protein S18 acetylase RimI-like enzyme